MTAESIDAVVPSRSGPTLLARTNMLLPGAYAWVTTVAYPVSQKGVGAFTRVVAFSALVALALGPLFVPARPRLARGLGVWGFVGLCLCTWLLLGSVIGIAELDPVRAAFGSIGWALFAFGWGAMRHWGSVPEEDPRVVDGPPLTPRASLPAAAGWVFAAGITAAGLVILLAWRVRRPVHALLAHALALTLAVWLINAATEVAMRRGASRGGSRQRFWQFALLALGGMGALWAILQAFTH